MPEAVHAGLTPQQLVAGRAADRSVWIGVAALPGEPHAVEGQPARQPVGVESDDHRIDALLLAHLPYTLIELLRDGRHSDPELAQDGQLRHARKAQRNVVQQTRVDRERDEHRRRPRARGVRGQPPSRIGRGSGRDVRQDSEPQRHRPVQLDVASEAEGREHQERHGRQREQQSERAALDRALCERQDRASRAHDGECGDETDRGQEQHAGAEQIGQIEVEAAAKPLDPLVLERHPIVARVPDDHRHEQHSRDEGGIIRLWATPPDPGARAGHEVCRGGQGQEQHRVLGEQPAADAQARPVPRSAPFLDQRAPEVVQRAGPAGHERRVGRHQQAREEEPGQDTGKRERSDPPATAADRRRQRAGVGCRDHAADQRARSHGPLGVAEGIGEQRDQPGDQRWVVVVPEIEVPGIVPVVGLFVEQLDHAPVDETQQDRVGRDPDRGRRPVPAAETSAAARLLPAHPEEHDGERHEDRERGHHGRSDPDDVDQERQDPTTQRQRQWEQDEPGPQAPPDTRRRQAPAIHRDRCAGCRERTGSEPVDVCTVPGDPGVHRQREGDEIHGGGEAGHQPDQPTSLDSFVTRMGRDPASVPDRPSVGPGSLRRLHDPALLGRGETNEAPPGVDHCTTNRRHVLRRGDRCARAGGISDSPRPGPNRRSGQG